MAESRPGFFARQSVGEKRQGLSVFGKIFPLGRVGQNAALFIPELRDDRFIEILALLVPVRLRRLKLVAERAFDERHRLHRQRPEEVYLRIDAAAAAAAGSSAVAIPP